MSIIQGTETVTARRSINTGDEDAYGNPVTSYIDVQVTGCLVAPSEGVVTPTLFREYEKIDLVVYAPAGTEFSPFDEFFYRGEQYTLHSEAVSWGSMANSILEPRVIVGLERYSG